MGEPSENATPSLLAGLTAADDARVRAAAQRRTCRARQALFRQDERAEALFLVESGRVKLTQLTPSGQEIIVRLAGPGELIAAIAVLDGRPYPFTATALEPTEVLLWPRAALSELFRSLPRFQANVIEVVGAHTREMLDRFRELATEPVPRRLARAVLRVVRLGGRAEGTAVRLERITQQDLADMAATTLYTVSRILSEWEGRRLVETGRGKLLVRDRDALARIAEEG